MTNTDWIDEKIGCIISRKICAHLQFALNGQGKKEMQDAGISRLV